MEEEKHLQYPHNRFNPHDPNHVTLQLIQEVHSQRIQMQLDRDQERQKRRELIGEVACLRRDLADCQAIVADLKTRHPEEFDSDDEE